MDTILGQSLIRYKRLGGRIGIFEVVLGDGYAELLHLGYL
jgi:hypothetical protein